MTNWLERFGAFVKTVGGVESIDDSLLDVHLEGKKRADYLGIGEKGGASWNYQHG